MFKPSLGLAGVLALTTVLVVLEVGSGLLGNYLVAAYGPFWHSTWAMGLLSLATLGITLAVGLLVRPIPDGYRTGLGLRPFHAKWSLGTGIWLVAFGGGIVLAQISDLTALVWPISKNFQAVFGALLSKQPALGTVFLLGLAAPLGEELVFRGLFFRSLSRRYGAWPAMFLSSAVFALVHMNPWQAGGAFLAGFYLAWLVRQTGSIFPGMIAHSVYNLIPVLLAWSGHVIKGYNDLPGESIFEPRLWLIFGILMLATGLWASHQSFSTARPPG